jgi:hypothetical protein
MPAVHTCEPAVIRAFEKAGWEILDHPLKLQIRKRENFVADLRLSKLNTEQTIIVVEVKCFVGESVLHEFYQAVGQYLHYRAALNIKGINEPVYLSIPADVYESLFQRLSVQMVVNDAKINLVIIDLQREEITKWLP